MPLTQTFGVMEFFKVVGFGFFFVSWWEELYFTPLIMEIFRVKILTYKAFYCYNMEAFLKKELFAEAMLSNQWSFDMAVFLRNWV